MKNAIERSETVTLDLTEGDRAISLIVSRENVVECAIPIERSTTAKSRTLADNDSSLRVSRRRGNGNSAHIGCPSLSADGRFVAFPSTSSNLVPGDTDQSTDLESTDIFVRDRLNQTTARVSVDPAGEPGNGRSDLAQISGDGQSVLFHSEATNLVEDDTNGRRDVFVRHLPTGTTRRVSVAVNGAQGVGGDATVAFDIVGIDQSGRYVVFSSAATNLVPGETIWRSGKRLACSVSAIRRRCCCPMG